MQEQYYSPIMRFIALMLTLALFILFPTISFYWVWSCLLYVFIHIVAVGPAQQISMEGLLTFVNYFELMAFIGFNPMAGTSMKMIQIKHIFKVNEFKLIRKSVFHSIFIKKLFAQVAQMKNLRNLAALFKIKNLSVPSSHAARRNHLPQESRQRGAAT